MQVANPFRNYLTAAQFPGQLRNSTTVALSTLLRPYPQFTGVGMNTSDGYSWYHSLQVRINKRLSRGASWNISYTFSKMMEPSTWA